jgi:hypothetical protein
MAFVEDYQIERDCGPMLRDAFLGANAPDLLALRLRRNLRGHIEQLLEPIVNDNDDPFARVTHVLDGAAPVGDDRERADDEDGFSPVDFEQGLPGFDGLAEANVVSIKEAGPASLDSGSDPCCSLSLVGIEDDLCPRLGDNRIKLLI